MARRINTRFLSILLLTLVGLGGGIYFLPHWLIHDRPETHMDRGNAATREDRWGDAVNEYHTWEQLDPENPEPLVKQAEALIEIYRTSGNPAVLSDAQSDLRQALEINPNNLAALQFLLQITETHDATSYRLAIDYAQRARVLAPDDPSLAVAPEELTLRRWLDKYSDDDDDVEKAIAFLQAHQAAYPQDAMIPRMVATALIRKGNDLARTGDPTNPPSDAKADYAQACQVFDDAIVGKPGLPSQTNNPSMHFQYSIIATMLANSDHSSVDARKKWNDLAWQEIQRAQALVKPADMQSFIEINRTAAQMAAQNGDPDLAEKILDRLPEIPAIVIQRAQLMGNREDGLPDAMQLLQSKLAALQDDPSQMIYYGPRYQLELLLTGFRIQDYSLHSDPAVRSQLDGLIEKSEDRLRRSAASRQALELDALEASFLLAKGEDVEVINRLSKLVATSDEANHNPNILNFLASAYAEAHQNSEAVHTLEQMISVDDSNIMARKRMVELLIGESPQRAQEELRALAQRDPDDPDIYRFEIRLLAFDATANKAQIENLYGRLPETTHMEIARKVDDAITLQKWTDAIRMLKQLVTRDPQDAGNVYRLGQIIAQQGDRPQAIEVIKKGLAANPDNQSLQLYLIQLQGASDTDYQKMRREFILKNPDKVQANLELAEMDGALGTHDGMVACEADLNAAYAVDPKVPKVWAAMFQLYLKQQRFDEAAVQIPKLAAANYDDCDGDLYRYALARARGDNASAIDIAARLCRDKPDFTNVWNAYGQVLQATQDYEGAIQQFAVALQKRANDKDALLGLIQCAQQLRKPDDVFQYVKEGMRRIPGDPDFIQLFLQHQLDQQDFNGALQTLEDFIKRNPDDPELQANLGAIYIQTAINYQSKNQQDAFQNLLAQAQKILLDANARWPDNPDIYDRLATIDFARRDPNAAVSDYAKLAARPLWKDRPEPYSRLAQIYERYQRFDKAEENVRLALSNSNYAVEYQIQAAAIFADQNKPEMWDEAVNILRVRHADQPEIRKQILIVLLAAGRFDSAQTEVQKYIADNKPDKLNLLLFWGEQLFDRKQYDQAINYANQALALDPSNPNALNTRGASRLRINPPDPSDALDDLRKVVRSVPSVASVHEDMADAYFRLGQMDQAITQMRTAITLDPNNSALRLKLVDALRDPRHPRLDEAYQLLHAVDATPPFSTDAGVFAAEAHILMDLHRTDEAVQASAAAVKLDPTRLDAVRVNLDALLADNAYADALNHLAELPDASRRTDWALFDVGQAHQGLADINSALDDWRAALDAAKSDTDPRQVAGIVRAIAVKASRISDDEALSLLLPHASENVAVRLALVQVYNHKSDPDSAVKILDDLMKNWDTLAPADQLAVAQAAANQYVASPRPQPQKAQDALHHWLNLQPDNMDALNDLALVLGDDYVPSRAKDGLPYAQHAVQTMNNNNLFVPKYLDTQGWLLVLSGKPEEGVGILADLIQSNPSPTTYMHLSEGYLQLADPRPDQALHEAQLGLQMLRAQGSSPTPDPNLVARLQSIIVQSQTKLKNQQP